MATKFELAHQAWPILVACARSRRSITYEDLASRIHFDSAQGLRHGLSLIQNLCLERDYPPLTILAVGKRSGLPGAGFIAWEGELQEANRRVFAFPWRTITRPF